MFLVVHESRKWEELCISRKRRWWTHFRFTSNGRQWGVGVGEIVIHKCKHEGDNPPVWTHFTGGNMLSQCWTITLLCVTTFPFGSLGLNHATSSSDSWWLSHHGMLRMTQQQTMSLQTFWIIHQHFGKKLPAICHVMPVLLQEVKCGRCTWEINRATH